MLKIRITFIFLFVYTIIYAQKADEFEAWYYSVVKDFENVNLNRIKSGSKLYNQIRYNLLSDKYFIPFYDKSFTMLSESKRKKLSAKIADLESDTYRGKPEYPWAQKLNFYLWGVLNQNRAYNQALTEINQLNTLRDEFSKLSAKIKSDDIEFDALRGMYYSVPVDFKTLLPSEISNMQKSINEKETQLANSFLTNGVHTIQAKENNYETLSSISVFHSSNYSYYKKADDSTIKTVTAALDKKTTAILEILIPPKKEQLDEIPYTKQGITEINAFTKKFNHDFNRMAEIPEIKSFYQEIKRKKTQIVIAVSSDINRQISIATTDKHLMGIQNTYLKNVIHSNAKMVQIDKAIEVRKSQLKEEEKLRLEQLEKERLLAELATLKKYGFQFNLDGITNKELFYAFFKGNFDAIPFSSDDNLFSAILSNFMYTQYNYCASSLPNLKEPIYEYECVEMTQTKDIYGSVIDEYCSQYGLTFQDAYTSPELYASFEEIRDIKFRDRGRDAFKIIKQVHTTKNFNSLNDLVSDGLTIESDIKLLIQNNGCTNTALQRFEQNLIQFALHKPGIQIDGKVEIREVDYSRRQNYTSLIDDLIFENSKGWAVNQYIRNSVSNVLVLSKNEIGQPTRISGTYVFNGLFGRQKFNVHLTFSKGIPDCIYFQDYPNTCRTADRKIVDDFVDGKYAQ